MRGWFKFADFEKKKLIRVLELGPSGIASASLANPM